MLLAACGTSNGNDQQPQAANTAGVAGFVATGSGGQPNAGAPPFGNGGAPFGAGGALTGQGGIIVTGGGGIPNGGVPNGGVPNGGVPNGGVPNGGVPGSGGVPLPGDGGAPGTGGAGVGGFPTVGGCGQSVPPVTDYKADGPFGPSSAVTVTSTSGPDGNYTMFKPANLGQNGFKHPPTTWGNGITTMPSYYDGLLRTIASHGFVIIASNSSNVTSQLMTTGLDWLVQQNSTAGDLQGKLDTKCLVSIGYSLGGGAAITTGNHADVITTVSMHGITGQAGGLHGPLLLFTSTTDTFVTAATFVTPNYNASNVQTFYATLSAAGDPSNLGHILPVGFGDPERAPMVAWLRLWAYGDAGAKPYFYGDSCTLCVAPWQNPQRKNWQ
jgi:hypothetical protein